jgi:hypothetical protein
MSPTARSWIAALLWASALPSAWTQGPGPGMPPATAPPGVAAPEQQPGTVRPVPPLQMPPPAPAPAVPETRVVPQISIPIGKPLETVPPLQAPPQTPLPADAGTVASERAALARCDALQGDAARVECRRRVFVGPSAQPGAGR